MNGQFEYLIRRNNVTFKLYTISQTIFADDIFTKCSYICIQLITNAKFFFGYHYNRLNIRAKTKIRWDIG